MTKVIGIDASRAFEKNRTGIEEYSFQVIKSLANNLGSDEVVLYVRSGQSAAAADFLLPDNWKIKIIRWPFFWTRIGLSLELFFHPVGVLFVPSHVVPLVHPENTFVTIHGLEYEFFPEGYSFWERLYMRLSIKASCQRAKKIIAVSENTKKDLVGLYQVPEEKIEVVYEGVNGELLPPPGEGGRRPDEGASKTFPLPSPCLPDRQAPPKGEGDRYLLFIGRLEARKNIIGIIKAFEILKEKYKIPHRLLLAGKFGYGKEKILYALRATRYAKDVIRTGFISEEEKRMLLREADVFLFPSFYEGFGLPILEAQAAGVPMVAGDVSSMPEVAGEGAAYADPKDHEQIASAVYGLISNNEWRDAIIEKGLNNVKRFSWEDCGRKIAKILAE